MKSERCLVTVNELKDNRSLCDINKRGYNVIILHPFGETLEYEYDYYDTFTPDKQREVSLRVGI